MEESFLLTVATNLGFCLSSLKSTSTECSLSFWVETRYLTLNESPNYPSVLHDLLSVMYFHGSASSAWCNCCSATNYSLRNLAPKQDRSLHCFFIDTFFKFDLALTIVDRNSWIILSKALICLMVTESAVGSTYLWRIRLYRLFRGRNSCRCAAWIW